MPTIRQVSRRTGRALFGVSGVGGITEDLKAQWDSSIAEFQTRRAELDSAESMLYEVYPAIQASGDADDMAEWNRVFSRVNAAKSSMDSVASLVQGAADAWNSFTGLFGLSATKMRRGGALAGLGFGPILPFGITIGGVATLTAAAVAAINLTYAFITWWNQKFSEQQILVDQGVEPREASDIAAKRASEASGYSVGGRIEKVALYALLGVGIVMLAPMLKRK